MLHRVTAVVRAAVLLTGLAACSSAQSPAAYAGRYACMTTQMAVAAGLGRPLGSLTFTPAFFGNVVLDGRGRYQLPSRKNAGTYSVNRDGTSFAFTSGDLRGLSGSRLGIDNGTYRFHITYESLSFECSRQSEPARAGTATAAGPGSASRSAPTGPLNHGLRGNLLVATSNNFQSYPGPVYRINLTTGVYTRVFDDGVGAQSAHGEIIYFDNDSRIKLTDSTGNLTLKQFTDRENHNFDDFFPAISPSGDQFALTEPYTANPNGLFGSMVSDGEKVTVYKRDGSRVAEFQGYAQAGFVSGGGLVMVGDQKKNRGLFAVDANYRTVRKIVEGFETATMPAASPDGRRVAFVKNGETWVIGIDGTNMVKVFGDGKTSFPVWSPDGQYVAAVYRSVPPGYVVEQVVVAVARVNTTDGFLIMDKENRPIPAGNRITWLP
jgi:WD40-like Beta Propeller Repeat